MTHEVLRDVAVECIVTGTNDRKSFHEVKLRELAASIQKHGLAQRPLLRELEGNRYEIVAGERRIRAMRDILGWVVIPAIVRTLSNESASALMLLENTGRVDLNPMEEATAYRARQQLFGWDIDMLAQTAGKSPDHVQARLLLLELTEDIQHYIRTGAFPEAYAVKLAEARLDTNRQRIALDVYNKATAMSLYRWHTVIQELTAQQQAEKQMPLFDLTAYLVEKVETMTNITGYQAVTGAAANRSLPPVQVSKDDSMAPIFDHYICALRDAGQDAAAGAVANLYNVFVAKGWVRVQGDLRLPTTRATGCVRDELHVEER